MATLFVGIDVANERLDACFLTEELRPVRPAAPFTNDPPGWSALRTAMVAAARLVGSGPRITIGMESTANMHKGIEAALRKEKRCPLEVHVLHPVSVKHFRRVQLKDSKTDRIDAELIAAYLVHMKPQVVEPLSEEFEELRVAVRARRGLIEARTQAKNQLHRLLRQYFPGYRTLIGKWLPKRLLTALETCPSPQTMLEIPAEELSALPVGPRHSIGTAFVEKLRQLAEQAPRPKLPKAVMMLVRGAAKRIRELTEQVAELDGAIEALAEEIVPEQLELLMSIPGVGKVTAAAILAEVGPVKRFPTEEKFIGYTGLYPTVWQSGAVPKRSGRMTWKGNRLLRTTLLVGSAAARQFNPAIAAYYERLRARGKSKRAAGGAIARKLAGIIFAVLRKGTPWSEEIAMRGIARVDEMAKVRQRKVEAACLTE